MLCIFRVICSDSSILMFYLHYFLINVSQCRNLRILVILKKSISKLPHHYQRHRLREWLPVLLNYIYHYWNC